MDNDLLPLHAVAPDVCVAPQLIPESMAEAARQGFKSVINNRPEGESDDQVPGAQIESAARALGIPAVTGVSDLLTSVRVGDAVLQVSRRHTRELREKNFMKIVSLAPEVL